jgi:PAS domain S-box-containing protein
VSASSSSAPEVKIWIIDDDPVNLRILAQIMQQQGYAVETFTSGYLALSALSVNRPDLMVLDIKMPDLDGYEVCQQLQANPASRDIPVIFISAVEATSEKVKAFAAGGADYITKPFQKAEVVARIQNQLRVRSLQKQLTEQNTQLQQEICERIEAEAAFRSSEAKYRDLVQTAHSIILRWDIQGFIRFLNEYGQQFFGFEESQIVGHSVMGTIVPKTETSGRDLHQLMQDICQHPERYLLNENENIRKDGERVWIAWANRPILDEQGQLVEILSVGTDITQRRSVEIALLQAKQEAEAANRVKSEFLARMSHELRTPLNAILGFSQLMARDPSLNETQKFHLDIILNSGDHLLGLINDILDMAKIEAGRLHLHETSFDLYHLLDTLENMLHLKAVTKGLNLCFDRTSNVPQYIRADEGKLRQILINLLSNAIKFTQAGYVLLRVRFAEGHDADIPDTLHFDIEDTGPGIASDEQDSIFEAFVQTQAGHSAQEGTGLGLPISRKVVQLMGGRMSVHSTLGQGTLFRFHIPINCAVAVDLLPPQQQQVVSLAPGEPQYRLLVVDDRWESRQLLISLLGSLGFEVREAEHGKAAIAIWETWQPHLIWMDMQMPIMDGYEATKHIKANPQGQTTVIVALTASALEEEKAMILAAGCDDFVRKPFRQQELFAKLIEHLGVQFLYAESNWQSATLHPQANQSDDHTLTADCLSAMPTNWVRQLHQAATLADEEFVSQLIAQIPASHAQLAHVLTDWMHNFRWDQILSSTQLAGVIN